MLRLSRRFNVNIFCLQFTRYGQSLGKKAILSTNVYMCQHSCKYVRVIEITKTTEVPYKSCDRRPQAI